MSGRQGKSSAIPIKHTPRKTGERLHKLEHTDACPVDPLLGEEQTPLHCQGRFFLAQRLRICSQVTLDVMRFNKSLRACNKSAVSARCTPF